MINKFRYFDVFLFPVFEKFSIDEIDFLPGIHQVKRLNNIYHLININNGNIIGEFSVNSGYKLLEKIINKNNFYD